MANSQAIIPVPFNRCAGWLHQSIGNIGVLLCSPLGLEELCVRRAWRMLATLCADADYPTLRFDYPGCGDSLGDLQGVDGIDGLADAAVEAAGELRRCAGVERIVVVGHGLGAAVAALVGPRIGAAAAALFAPPTSGRVHVRELELWGRRVAEGLGFAPGAAEAEGVGGFRLPPAMRASIEALDLRTLPAPAPSVFLAGRPSCTADAELAERLSRHGSTVAVVEYAEHAAALEAPTGARPPLDLFAAFSAWLPRAAPARPRRAAQETTAAAFAGLQGEAFNETLLRFGPGGRLAGVACAPAAPRLGATVLFLNAGGDPHTGWARGTVTQARALARRGVASFRIDMSDLGDSAGPPDSAPPRVFDPLHVDDALAAVDWLEANGLGPVMPVGRCSGATIAFSAAARDPRIRDLVLVNPPRLAPDLAALVARPANRLAYYLGRTREPVRLLRRWRRGEVDLRAAFGKLTRAVARLGLGGGAPDDDVRALHAELARLGARGGRMTVLFTENDPHRTDIQAAIGDGERRFGAHDAVELRFLEHADAALTAAAARAALLELLIRRALEGQPASVAGLADRKVPRREQDSGLPAGSPRPRPTA